MLFAVKICIESSVLTDIVHFLVAANKCDLPKREVSSQEVRDIAREYAVPVIETSAKTRQGVVSNLKDLLSVYLC